MPATDPEPENYSIDDIMDRLRSRGDGGREGEAQLVTREDGTQVYRVRKRKRRSQQPKKEKEKRQRRMHIGLIVASVALVILLGLAFIGSWFYLNSSGYREGVSARIRAWTGAEPKLTELTFSPVSVGAGSLELKWPETSVLDKLRLNGISGNLEAAKLLSGKWKGHELYSAQGGQLVLRPGVWGATARSVPEGECPFEFRYRANKFSVLMGAPEKPVFLLRDSEVTFTAIDPRAGTANLQFNGGNLESAVWGNLSLTFASLQFEEGKVNLGNLRMSPTGVGKGEIQVKNPDDLPLDPSGEGTALDVEMAQMPLSDLLGPSFGSWFVAVVETPDDKSRGKLLLSSKVKSGLSLRVPFRNIVGNDPSIGALPLFVTLAAELDEPWYNRPRFDTARGEIIKDGEIAGVETLNLETRSRLSLTGRVIAKRDGTLEGTLEIVLPLSLAEQFSPQMRAIFSKRSGEYYWATCEISGNSHSPQDDLEKRLAAAATTHSATSGGGEDLEKSFRELTTPATEK